MGTRSYLALVALTASVVATNAWSAVGRTAGQFNVSSTGSAQYAIPIWAPPGPHGAQPQISLFYNSQSGIGPLGVGWSIAGLGEITRCNKTVAQDTTAAPVALLASDGYCINGNRLRLTSEATTYGQPNSTYQTEIADFSNITASPTSQGNGPAYFIVQGRNGLTYYYGFTDTNGNGANSQVLAKGTSTALTWLLSKVVDRAGNNYVINYTTLSGTLIGTAMPNTIYWTPTSAGATSYSYTMQFGYTPNGPESSINKYVAGTNVSNPQRLSSIEILYGTTVVKDYFIGYTPSPTTAREQITSVQECPNTTQSDANCLEKTTVAYGVPSKGVSTTSNSALSSTGGTTLTARYDLNGDGIPDLVYNTGTEWYVAFGSPTGYGTPVSTGISASNQLLPGNLNAGTQDGFLAPNGSTWYYYTWNGTAFAGVSTGIAYNSTASYQLADINGDGLPDLISLIVTSASPGPYNASVDTRLNTSSGATVSFSSTLTVGYTWDNVTGAVLQSPDVHLGKLRHYDFNGDGLDDLAITIATPGIGGNSIFTTFELITTGSTFSPVNIAIGEPAAQTIAFVDWNDDKCTDLTFNDTLYISGCDGTVAQTITVGGTVVGAMDWDGDGRADLLVSDGSTMGVYLSTGTGISSSMLTTSLPYSSACEYITMDATGGGLDDLGCWSQSASEPLTYYLHNGVPDLMTNVMDGFGNSVSPTYVSLAQSNYTQYSDATFGYANYIGPLYVVSEAVFSDPSAQNPTYNQTFWYYGAWVNLQGRGFQSFYGKRMIDSRNGLYYFQYYERAFPYTGMDWEDVLSNNDAAHISVTIRTPTSTTLSTTTNEERYFPYFSNITNTRRELGGVEDGDPSTTTSTDFTYDNYGNALTINKTVTDTDPGSPYVNDTWTTKTANTTDIATNRGNDLTAWCLNMLVQTQVTYSSSLSGSTSVTRTKNFGLDTPTACRVTSIVTEPTANGGLDKVTEALTFDTFGNLQTDTVTGANMPSSPATRVTTLNWGMTGQFLNTLTVPIGTVANPATATTTWSYTSSAALAFGVPDSVKDANNLTTSWLYDAFGRKTKESRPDATSTAWSWSACTLNCGWSNSVYQIAQTAYQTNGSTAIRTDTTSYDPIDRVTQIVGPTVAGTTATVQKLYNSMGLLAQQSMPFLTGTPYLQNYYYDVLNRPTSVTRPVSSTKPALQSTSYAYAGRTLTVSDPYENKKTLIADVNGWLRQTKDAIGYSITRAYDAAGSLTGVTDNIGNTLLKNVTYNYGIKPFLVAATDADRGAWIYKVDSLGERIGWTDAKGQSFSMAYDAQSRPFTRSEPDLFTQWTWGSTPASDNVGQLIDECTAAGGATSCASPLYDDGRQYDSDGRLSSRSIRIGAGEIGNDPDGTFKYTYAYNATTGFLDTLTYPISTSGAALKLQYGYGYGLLQSITDTTDTTSTCGTTCVLWTANTMNGFGQITQETLGNGVVSTHSYDPVTSWLTGATAGVGGGAALLNQSYMQDENGNVIQRQNNNSPGLTESFAYDADNRLVCALLSSTCPASTATITYDNGSAGPGNIWGQSGVGTYTYPAPGQPQPHAVTSITGTFNGITNPTFSYDPNGNMIKRASSSQNIYWSSYNYPLTISASDVTGSEDVQFSYGPDRQRWLQVYSGPSGTEETYYIGGLMDLVFNGTTNYRHYIYAGSEPIAVYSRTSTGMITLNYLLEDHQGGVSDISSNSGADVIDESFSAFGQRRNPTTWSGVPTTADLNTIAGISRQGYIFQTWLGQSMGLNHMNGRVQDAILGRFLSPDPHIPDPSNAQSYNRYSYVNNNPLTYRDPTGFKGCKSCGNGDDDDDDDDDSGGSPDPTPPPGPSPQPDPCSAAGSCLPPVQVQCTFCCGSDSGCWDSPTFPPPTPFLPPGPIQFPRIAPAQGQNPPVTPCPDGALANFSYALYEFGINSMKTGGAGAVLAKNGMAAALPYADTPAGADAILANEALGLASDLTFLIGAGSAAAGGGYLAYNGDPQPLNATTTTILQSVGEDAAHVPNVSPTDPLDGPIQAMAGTSSCIHQHQ